MDFPGGNGGYQSRGHRFNPWSRKIPHAIEQLGPSTTTTEPTCHNQRTSKHTDEDPVQPKINKNFFKPVMILVTKKGGCKGSRKYNLFYISQNCHLNSLEMIPINAAFMVKF